VTWLYFVAFHGQPAALQQSAYAIGKSIQFALPIVWLSSLSGSLPRRWPKLPRPDGPTLGIGLAFGLLVLAAIVLLYYAWLKPSSLFEAPAVAVRDKIKSFGIQSVAGYIALAAFYSLVHSLLEEYYWRWFVFGMLKGHFALAAAIAVSSVGFAAHHVLLLGHYFGYASPLTWLFAAAIVVGGAVWAWLYARSGSLWATWLSHALVDAAIFVVGWDLLR
jgi:membrane protease YdiL (CAAX protease family)